ncbi:efflux RND transporter periplasmic adaptor subunit [Rhodoferax sp. 4810]|uniref:Efflux RND transporter periplasmic adaptor subunit n=1 Tax=Thiospirillum jenense TaxID=1653858 RepID=A0A839H4G3_9GAMM|nr:efflux RND transporter periplasmic adaptor subunit [Thiospirillum jenense]MBB1076553.1 efflux RND transporter periplasmic adaptor subunit [Rhodoferax jenense]MBB1124741.1 efflux RND transporter periplasmic adaptor subunit [Thiospirillum jenense]
MNTPLFCSVLSHYLHTHLTRWLLVILTGTTVFLFGCQGESVNPMPANSPRQAMTHPVLIQVAEITPATVQYQRPGYLQFKRQARLFSQEEGIIENIAGFAGDAVASGQLLVQLNDAQLRAEYDRAGAIHQQKIQDRDRLIRLAHRGATTDDSLAQAETAVAIALAEKNLLNLRLNTMQIMAPFAGMITERLIEPHDFVDKNTHLITIVETTSLIAEVYVSELMLPQLRTGDRVQMCIDALNDRVVNGRIQRIHPTLIMPHHHALVEIAFDELPPAARAGQLARVTFTSPSQPRLLIALSALHYQQMGAFVWVMTNEKTAARRPVTLGLRIDERIEITTGLAVGEQVITRGSVGLNEGAKVELSPLSFSE